MGYIEHIRDTERIVDNDQDGTSLMTRLRDLLWSRSRQTDSREQIEKILDEVEDRGLIEEDQGDMIYNIIELKDTCVREIMTPKIEMVALESTSTIDDLVAAIREHGCSRIPIYEGSLDNIIGVVFAKDVLRYWPESPGEAPDLKSMVHPSYFVPEGKKLTDLLDEFKRKRTKIAFVIDEYGNVDGMVTIGDLIEEIVGDMQEEDAHDDEDPLVVEMGGGTFGVDPLMPIDEFAEAFDVEIPEGCYDTVGGFITCRLEKIPEPGEVFEFDGLRFEVAGADRRRIERLLVHQDGEPMQ